MELDGKTIIITGASSGIGRAAAPAGPGAARECGVAAGMTRRPKL